jgi:hypothetical protein
MLVQVPFPTGRYNGGYTSLFVAYDLRDKRKEDGWEHYFEKIENEPGCARRGARVRRIHPFAVVRMIMVALQMRWNSMAVEYEECRKSSALI